MGADARGAGCRTRRPHGGRPSLCALLLGASVAGCAPGDPFPGRPHDAPPGRAADALLERPDLQALAEAALDRDAGPLIAALADADAAVRARAAYGLASVQDSAAVGPLERLLADPDPDVRADAAFALGQTPGGVGAAVVRALAAENDTTVRRLLAEAIGKRGEAGELDPLRSVADTALLPRATLALSQGVIRGHAPDATLDLLIERMGHDDPRVRAAATYFVARTEPDVWWSRRLHVRAALAALDVDDPAAMYLLAGLGRRMDGFSRPLATRFLVASTDWRIRANAAAALGAEESILAVNARRLVAALDDSSPHVRLQAATGLASGGPDTWTIDALARWVEAHPDAHVTAAPLLPFLAQAGRGELVLERIRALPRDRPGLWTQAMEALALVGGEEAVRATGRVLRDPEVPEAAARLAAAELVGRWEISRTSPGAVDVFLDVARDAVAGPRPVRAAGLVPVMSDPLAAGQGGRELLERLAGRLRDGPARQAVQEALARGEGTGAAADAGGTGVSGTGEATDEATEAADEADEEASDPADEGTTAAGEGRAAPRPRLAVDWEALRRLGPSPRFVLDTEKGTVVLRLRTEEAPLTVQAIAALAEAGRYDGTPFHRVVPNFVVQGGDVAAGDGSGGPGFVIRSEFTRTPYLRGVLGMASSGKDTEGSQVFVTHAMQPHLDGGYTAFGWVERGMDVVDVIEQGDRLLRARVIPGS